MQEKRRNTTLVSITLFVLLGLPASALDNGLCLTPPMGWNSWNYFNCSTNFNETTIRAIADAMVSSGMKELGYQYINLDDCWAERNRDATGALVPNKTRFPNFKGMVQYIHSKGLKVGLYSDVGRETCAGSMPGSLNHEQQDADSLVSWGIDYLKYDFCGGRNGAMNAPIAYAKMRDCLATAVTKARAAGNTSAHPVVFAICEWGANSPWTWAPQTGNLWRTFMDIETRWARVTEIIDTTAGLWRYAKPGAWNDPDMLEVGNGMSANQDKIHFSLWCMMAAPLIAGNDLRNMSATTKSLLTNPELIAIDQDSLGMQGRRIVKNQTNGTELWVRKLRNNQYAVAFYNAWGNPTDITVTWSQIASTFGDQLSSSATLYVRDVVKRQDLGTAVGQYTAKTVPTQDIVVVKISPYPNSTPAGRRTMGESPAGGVVKAEEGAVVFYDIRGAVLRGKSSSMLAPGCYLSGVRSGHMRMVGTSR